MMEIISTQEGTGAGTGVTGDEGSVINVDGRGLERVIAVGRDVAGRDVTVFVGAGVDTEGGALSVNPSGL